MGLSARSFENQKQKILQIGRRNQITIPAEFIPPKTDQFSCQKREDGSLLLIPLATIPASQAYFWTKRWQEGERQASDDIKHGRYKDFDHVEDLIKDLEEARARQKSKSK